MIKSKGLVLWCLWRWYMKEQRSRDEIPLYRCYFFQGVYQVFEKLPQLKIKRSCLQRFLVLFKSSNVLPLLNMIVGSYGKNKYFI